MRRAVVLALALCPLAARAAGGLHESKHNLSITGPGAVRATSETRACIFCHVTHGSRDTKGRPESKAIHRTYRSSTMAGEVSAGVDGASRTCLSCHDGTIALGQTAYGLVPMVGTGPGGRMPPGKKNLGTDLTGSHPVSFRPSQMSRNTRQPPPGDAVRLDRHGRMQCTSCHDPHSEDGDPETKKFLVKRNHGGSAICQTCHTLPFWEASAHQGGSNASGIATLRFGSTGLSSGCATCHAPHGGSPRRLVKGDALRGDDEVCLDCHDGRTARFDLRREVTKPYAHAAPSHGPSGHDATEGPQNHQVRLPESRASDQRHVACIDCHDPHAARAEPLRPSAPRAPSTLAGTWGIDRNGLKVQPVNFEYEVCFKCHGDSMNQPQARGPRPPQTVRRATIDANLRRVFSSSAPSAHPVVSPGRNPDVPSLLPPLGTGSMIYCGDCHGSDTTTGAARGPHGSIYPSLLERNYSTADGTPESPQSYALCYKCHDRNVLLSDASAFRLHRRHVVDQATPCSACHNAHGVSPLAANPQSGAHLIDFDTTVVKPGPRGLRQYATRGFRAGTCTLSCHGVPHDDRAY